MKTVDYKGVCLHVKEGLKLCSGILSWCIRQHPFIFGMTVFFALLYRSFPALFLFLISTSPVLLSTTILLGTLLKFGLNNIPELIGKEETSINYFGNDIEDVHGVQDAVVIEGRAQVEEMKDGKFVNTHTAEGLEPLPNYEFNGAETSSNTIHEERQKFANLLYGDLKGETDSFFTPSQIKINAESELDCMHLERRIRGKEIAEGLIVSEIKGDSTTSNGKTFGRSNSRRAVHFVMNDIIDKSKEEIKIENYHDKEITLDADAIGDHEEHTNPRLSSCGHIGDPYWVSDSGSETAENSSPDTDLTNLTPMIGGLHPLLDPYELSQPTYIELLNGADKSSESCVSEHEYVGDEDDHNERSDLGQEDICSEDQSAEVIDGIHVHLCNSKLERYQPLEILTPRHCYKSSQQIMEEKGTMALEAVVDQSDHNVQAQQEVCTSQVNEDGGQEEVTGFTWTGDDTGYVMDLGSSELERNKRLENLMAKRRAKNKKKSKEREVLIYLHSDDDDQSGIIEVNESGIVQDGEIGEEEMVGVTSPMRKYHASMNQNPVTERGLMYLQSNHCDEGKSDGIGGIEVEDICMIRQDENERREKVNKNCTTLHHVSLGSHAQMKKHCLENRASKCDAKRDQMTNKMEDLIDLQSDDDLDDKVPIYGFQVENEGGWNQEDKKGGHELFMSEEDAVRSIKLESPVFERNQTSESLVQKNSPETNQIVNEEDLIYLQSDEDDDENYFVGVKEEVSKMKEGKSVVQEKITRSVMVENDKEHDLNLHCFELERSQHQEKLMEKGNTVRNQGVDRNRQSVEEAPLIGTGDTPQNVTIETLPFQLNLSSIKKHPSDLSYDGEEAFSKELLPTSTRAPSAFLENQKSFRSSCQQVQPVVLKVPSVHPVDVSLCDEEEETETILMPVSTTESSNHFIRKTSFISSRERTIPISFEVPILSGIKGSPFDTSCDIDEEDRMLPLPTSSKEPSTPSVKLTTFKGSLCDEDEETETILAPASTRESSNCFMKQNPFPSSYQQAAPISFQAPNLCGMNVSPFDTSCDRDEEAEMLPLLASNKAPSTPSAKLFPFTPRYEQVVLFETAMGESSNYDDFMTSSGGKDEKEIDGNRDHVNKVGTINPVESTGGHYGVASPIGSAHHKPLKDQSNDDLFTSPLQDHCKSIDVNKRTQNEYSNTSSLHTQSDSVVEFHIDHEGLEDEQTEVSVQKLSHSRISQMPIKMQCISDSSARVPQTFKKQYIPEHEGCDIKGIHSIATCSRKYAGVAHAAELCQPLLAKHGKDFIHVDAHSSDIEEKLDSLLIPISNRSSSFGSETIPTSIREPREGDESVPFLSSSCKPESSKASDSQEKKNAHEGYVQLSSDDATPANNAVHVTVLDGSQLSNPTTLFDWTSSLKMKHGTFHVVPLELDDELQKDRHDVTKEECKKTSMMQDMLSVSSDSPIASVDLNLINTSTYGTSHSHLGVHDVCWLEGGEATHIVGPDDQEFMTELFTIGSVQASQEIPSIKKKEDNLESHASDGFKDDSERSSFTLVSVPEPNPVQHSNLYTAQFWRVEPSKLISDQLDEHEKDHMHYDVPETSQTLSDGIEWKDDLYGIGELLKETSEGAYVEDKQQNNDTKLLFLADNDSLEVVEARTIDDCNLVLEQFNMENPGNIF